MINAHALIDLFPQHTLQYINTTNTATLKLTSNKNYKHKE